MLKFFRSKIVRYTLESLGILLLLASLFPIMLHYLEASPPWGVDFYITPAYIAYLKRYFALPMTGWKYTGSGGCPFYLDYSWLHFYPMTLLHLFLDLLTAVRLYLVATYFAFILSCYFLFRYLSKSPLFAFFVSLALAQNFVFSHQMLRGGHPSSAATQIFLPLIVLSLAIYLEQGKRRFFYLSVLFLGLSFYGHGGMTVPFALFAAIIFFFWRGRSSLEKLGDLLYYTLLSLLLSLFVTFNLFIFASIGAKGFRVIGAETPFSFMMEETPLAFWGALGALALVLLTLAKVRRGFFEERGWLALTLATGFSVFWVFLFKIDRNPVPHLGPARILWMVLLFASALVCLIWKHLKDGWISYILKGLMAFLLLISFVWEFIPAYYFRTDSILSPDVARDLYVSSKRARAEEKLIPADFDPMRKDYRLWHMGYGFGMWWPAFFDLPLVNGVFDTFFEEGDFWTWMNSGLTSEEEIYTGISERSIINSHLYLFDWAAALYAAKLEPRFSEILLNNKEEVFSKVDVSPTGMEIYNLKEELVSPIASATNAPTVYVLGGKETVNVIMRIMAVRNINSQRAILIRGEKLIDDLDSKELEGIDIVFLYDYYYKMEKDFKERPEKPWQALEDFVNAGGKLFIDTGANAKEEESSDLPKVFPVSETRRGCLGTNPSFDWSDQIASPSADTTLFSPFVYDGDCWTVSYGEGVKDGAEVLLEQEGKPVLVRWHLGGGEVIWTGLNLPYRFAYHNNDEEAKFFESVLGMLGVGEGQAVPSKFSRPKSEKVVVSSDAPAKGILFKENYDSGWKARLSGAGSEVSRLRIRKAGPGFMYARLPINTSVPFKVEFLYRGSFKTWTLFIISAFAFIFVLGKILFGEEMTALSQRILKHRKEGLLGDEDS